MMLLRKCVTLGVLLWCGAAAGGQAPAAAQAAPVVDAKAVAEARQQKLRDEVARLVAMAASLKATVEITKKDELSVEVIREANRIEVLAKSLKEQPRQP